MHVTSSKVLNERFVYIFRLHTISSNIINRNLVKFLMESLENEITCDYDIAEDIK